MKTGERIPLHDHRDLNSGGPLDPSRLVRHGLGGGSSGSSGTTGGGGGGGTTPTPSGGESVIDHGDMGSTETISVSAGSWHRGTLDDDCTITVEGFTVDEGLVAVVEVAQDGTGGWAITWDADVDFIGSDQPDTTASTVTVFLLFSSAGDSTVYGVRVGGASAEASGHYEVLMDGGSPPEPVEDGSGTDWLYVFVPA